MQITFEAVGEDQPGPKWQGRFQALWPHYRRWYLGEGFEKRPTYLQCERAMRDHMPELVPTWERLVALAGDGDLEARFLSLYCPPPYLSGCSQSVWIPDWAEPILVRNYDYSPHLFEKLFWHSQWNGHSVLATTDCLIGVLDGINSHGLVVSLNFGGMKEVGVGFGAPMVLRYLLEFCSNVTEASRVLRRVPVHMAYNILVLDRAGNYVTAYTRPDGPTILHRTPASTNHQDRIAWARHATATATLERERRLFELLGDRRLDEAGFIGSFLEPPLRQTQYLKGYGTLYTAIYRATRLEAEYRWPGQQLSLAPRNWFDQVIQIELPEDA
jgi:predicted choloylglycine hydrolase